MDITNTDLCNLDVDSSEYDYVNEMPKSVTFTIYK